MGLIFVGLALICFLGADVNSREIPDAASGAQSTSTTSAVPVLPTESTPAGLAGDNATDDNVNSTLTVVQITDYNYFDWPKIGYQIFMQKMLDAIQTLKFFMSLDPMVLKVTRTYILTNDTDLDYDDNNNSTDVNSNEISSSQADQSIETNTESPLAVQVYEDSSLEDNSDKNTSSIKDKSQENNSIEPQNGVKETNKENGGFFSSIARAVSSFYHAITNWF